MKSTNAGVHVAPVPLAHPSVRITSPLTRFTTEYKCYAPGLGMVSDGTMKLVKVVKGRP